MPERISIPAHLKIANIKDFYDKLGNPIIGLEFHVYTYHSGELEKHKIHKGEDILKFYPWIKDNRTFVSKEGYIEMESPKKNINVVESKQTLKLDEF